MLTKGIENARARKIFDSLMTSEPFKTTSETPLTMDTFQDIYPKIKYEHFAEGDAVFKHGDFGNKFYIIIKGSVSVLIPKKKQNAGDNTNRQLNESPVKKEQIIGNPYTDYCASKPVDRKTSSALKQYSPVTPLRQATSQMQLGNNSFTQQTSKVPTSFTATPMVQQYFTQEDSVQSIPEVDEVATLTEGQNFGEFALIH